MTETKLVSIPTHVRPSTDKDGRKRPAHISTRQKRVAFSVDSSYPQGHESASALDGFIAKHGGPDHLRETLEKMEPHERAKLLDAMAHVDNTSAAAVMKKLGIHEPEASEDEKAIREAQQRFTDRLAKAREEGVITAEEHDSIATIADKEGLPAAIAAMISLREEVSTAPAAPASEVEPAATAAAAEGAAGHIASLHAQADEIYGRHVDSANKAVRAAFEIKKREVRGWKVPEAMRELAAQHHADAARYLAEWEQFRSDNNIGDALS